MLPQAKIEATVKLWAKTKHDEDVHIELIGDDLSAQMSVLLDGVYFAHIRVDEKLQLSIVIQDDFKNPILIQLDR